MLIINQSQTPPALSYILHIYYYLYRQQFIIFL